MIKLHNGKFAIGNKKEFVHNKYLNIRTNKKR